MSTSNQASEILTANFTAIFEGASIEYKALTGQDLQMHPFAAALENTNSPDSVLGIFQEQAQAVDKFRKRHDKLMNSLTPIVRIIFALSASLGDGINIPFSPAKTIFTGVGVLLEAARDVISSYGTLVKLFERIQYFLQRLNDYTEVPLTPAMIGLLGKIMAEVLSILAFSAKTMKGSGIKRLAKRLLGNTDVDDALERLNELTKEENLMTAARTLKVVHHVDDNVEVIKDVVHNVDGNVKGAIELSSHVDQNVTAIKEDICNVGDHVKANMELVHHVDNDVTTVKVITSDVYDRVNVIDAGIRGVRDDFGEMIRDTKIETDRQEQAQLRDRLRTWLDPPNPSLNHTAACDKRYQGTAGWFLRSNVFDDWKENGSVLWISGNPGAGKSVLCSAIIEDIKHIRESRSALLAYHYFDFRDPAKRDVRGLLTSLLIQLCDGSENCWDILSQFSTTCGNGSDHPSDTALANCLKTMLDLPGQVPIFIIIDALDECPDNTGTPSAREKLLDFVEDLVQSNHSNLSLCITSRPEQDIRIILDPLIYQSRRVSLHQEDGQRDDIHSYIHSFIQKDRSMRRWRAEDKEAVINALTERADGMFRWVYCQLDNLRRCIPSSIQKALDELPITLDDTYERILQGIPKQKQGHAHQLFQCMVAAIRPLRVEELAEIFAINLGPNTAPILVEGWRPEHPEDAVLSTCSTLVAIIDDRDSRIVQFSHFSVKEFLTSDRLRTSEVGSIRDYYLPLEPAHAILARSCLTVLLQLDGNVDKKRLATFPLAFYAARHWVDHAKYGDVISQIGHTMNDLFNPKGPYLASWTWIHDPQWEFARSIGDLSERPPLPDSTPLYYAASCGLSRLAEHLVISDPEDVNSTRGSDETPLRAASRRGYTDVARVLLDHGANPNATNYADAPLTAAFDYNHLEIMQLLLARGVDLRASANLCGSTLRTAAFKGRTEVIQLLLRYHADPNDSDDNGMTALHCASTQGHFNVVQLLLEHGADVNARTWNDYTPLRMASQRGYLDIVRLLLGHGADKQIQGKDDLTPLQAATAAGHHDIAQLTIEAPGDGEE